MNYEQLQQLGWKRFFDAQLTPSERDTCQLVRVSAHPGVRALCEAFGGPLVSTSANRAGARPALHAFQVRRYFGDGIDYLLPGRLGASDRPSTIRDLASGHIIRD